MQVWLSSTGSSQGKLPFHTAAETHYQRRQQRDELELDRLGKPTIFKSEMVTMSPCPVSAHSQSTNGQNSLDNMGKQAEKVDELQSVPVQGISNSRNRGRGINWLVLPSNKDF